MHARLILFLLISFAAGCGQKGPLFLPGDVSGGTVIQDSGDAVTENPPTDDEESEQQEIPSHE